MYCLSYLSVFFGGGRELFVICLSTTDLRSYGNKSCIEDISFSLFKVCSHIYYTYYVFTYFWISEYINNYLTPSKNPFHDHPNVKQDPVSSILCCFNFLPITYHYLTLCILKFICLLIIFHQKVSYMRVRLYSHVYHWIP